MEHQINEEFSFQEREGPDFAWKYENIKHKDLEHHILILKIHQQNLIFGPVILSLMRKCLNPDLKIMSSMLGPPVIFIIVIKMLIFILLGPNYK